VDDAAPPAPPVFAHAGDAFRWCLEAEADPQLPARVLACFTVRNALPTRFRMRASSCDRLRIAFEARMPDEAAAERLGLRLRAIPTVIEVRWSRRAGARPT
jgi:hypothetical protein